MIIVSALCRRKRRMCNYVPFRELNRQLSQIARVTMVNLDNRKTFKSIYYSDASMGWILTRSSSCLEPDKKYFHVLHNGRSLICSRRREMEKLSRLALEAGSQESSRRWWRKSRPRVVAAIAKITQQSTRGGAAIFYQQYTYLV